jgi:YfiH family protein
VSELNCIRHPLFESIGVVHGFGTRDSSPPAGTLRPIQVHGSDVLRIERDDQFSRAAAVEADAIVCRRPGKSVAIVTADCVPILACNESGSAVGAIHAGWRGLAKGVVEAGVEALREIATPGEDLRAVIGPHIGHCCYEDDAPVLEAMTPRFGAEALAHASSSTSATARGHAYLSLATLVETALDRVGIPSELRDRVAHSCTSCESERFFSYRREGKRAGRMVHFIATTQE